MWSLKPYNSPPSTCPGCNAENKGFDQYMFTGLHILGMGVCASCNLHYYHNWPIGHGAQFPISFSDNGTVNHPEKAVQWLAKPLIKSVKQNLTGDARITRKIRRPISKALLLNCLDPCYGHVLWKLFNASRYGAINPPQGLVVLIPENCVWLVPDYVAEIWSVKAPLNSFNFLLPYVEKFVREVTQSFESLHLCPVATHMDHTDLDYQQFLQIRPFCLEDFYSKPATITLIWREDRFWIRSEPERWLSLAAKKFSIRLLKTWLIYRQLKKMIKLVGYVRQAIPEAVFKVTGLGTKGNFPVYIEDLRQTKLTEHQERAWCQVYADSQLVIGVHGSNMLIPTALSAGFIELMPRDKIPFITEDILMKHSPRLQLFLGRHLDVFSSAKVISQHVVSIFRDFDYVYKNFRE